MFNILAASLLLASFQFQAPAIVETNTIPRDGSASSLRASPAASAPTSIEEPACGEVESDRHATQAAGDAKDDAKAEPKVELKWKKPDGQANFDAGVAAFEKEEYRTAEGLFKDAKRHAKNKATKNEIKRWRRGVRGGVMLKALTEKKKKKREIWVEAQKAMGTFEGTPVAAKYKDLVDSLGKEVSFLIEGFERVSNRYSEKFGKKFVDDEKIVRSGKRCIEWKTTGNDAELKVEKLPRDLSAFHSVSVWINFPKRSAPYQLVFKGKGKTQSNYGQSMTNAFLLSMKPHKGWKRIDVPLKSFAVQGDVKWSSIQDFRIQFIGKRNVLLHVDDIMLIRDK